MAKDKNKIDLLNGPLELARQMSKDQLQSFRNQFLPEPPNPLADVLHEHGLTLKGLRNGDT